MQNNPGRSTLLRLAELEEQRRRGHEEAAARSRNAGLRAARERDVARDAARSLARAACRVRERVRDAVNSRSFQHVAREAEESARTLRRAPPW
ncbi:coiled-coil domain-containing protein 177-like [Lethenteron reissneri]|uniref:coiled-coil domain-containing protein 177-like n=1 Tax=Lethenteron reissneri TaxID=7753 RepID=UPI002AB6BD4E|nr:coiled-coil domain-containing protein 177-like [Lethenteron reissneri]